MDARRGAWTTTLVIGAMSLIPRLYAALAWARAPVWDGHYYDSSARRIVQGLGYSYEIVTEEGITLTKPYSHYPVGYSGFLAGLYAVFGDGQYVATIANAFLGAVAVVLVHRIGLYWLSPRRAMVAALLCGLHLEFVFYSPLVMTEVLAATLPLLALWIALASGRSLVGAAGAGGVLGLATLVQPPSILLAPLLGSLLPEGRLLS